MTTNSMKPCVSLVSDANAVEDAAMVLDDHLKKVQELDGLTRKELAPLRMVSLALANVSSLVKRNAKAHSPGAGDPEWVNNWKEKERKLQKLVHGPIRPSGKSKPVGSIESYNREKENGGRGPARWPVRNCIQINDTIPIPSQRPSNGFEFDIVEAMKSLDRARKFNSLLVHWFAKGWIPVQPRRCYNIFKKYKAGESVVWRGAAVDGSCRGRPNFCGTSDVLDGCRDIQEAKHQAITLDDVKEVMTAIDRKHLVEHGSWAYGTSATPSRRTIARYLSFAVEEMIVKLSIGEVQAKTNTRYTAENVSAMGFLLVQAISGFIVGKPHSKMKPLETATEGAQLLANLVSKANGNASVYPVQPGMITTTDGTTVFACVGIADQFGGKQWKLLDADESYSLRSAYVVGVRGRQGWSEEPVIQWSAYPSHTNNGWQRTNGPCICDHDWAV
jgi:hypothetical protein